MPGRSHARWLAPLALAAFVVALILVVSSSGGGSAVSPDGGTPTERVGTSAGGGDASRPSRRRSGRRIYRVRTGDTPSTIAEKTGITLVQLQELNPDLDPQQLTPGQRLRPRR